MQTAGGHGHDQAGDQATPWRPSLSDPCHDMDIHQPLPPAALPLPATPPASVTNLMNDGTAPATATATAVASRCVVSCAGHRWLAALPAPAWASSHSVLFLQPLLPPLQQML